LALTPAQKQKAYRERQKLKLDQPKNAYFNVQGALVDDLDYLAKFLDISRSKVVQDLLSASIQMVLPTIKKGAEEMQDRIDKLPEATPETIDAAKMAFWDNSLGAMKS